MPAPGRESAGFVRRAGGLGMTPARYPFGARTRRNPEEGRPCSRVPARICRGDTAARYRKHRPLAARRSPPPPPPQVTGTLRRRRPDRCGGSGPKRNRRTGRSLQLEKMARIAPAFPPFGVQGPHALASADDDRRGGRDQSAGPPTCNFSVHNGARFPQLPNILSPVLSTFVFRRRVRARQPFGERFDNSVFFRAAN